jgi:broad specificity phosphatase PhoE
VPVGPGLATGRLGRVGETASGPYDHGFGRYYSAPVPVVYLIRHAQASFGGDSYDVLSELGHRQAEALAASLELRGARADRVVSGGLRRQLDTARACVDGDDIDVDARWDEYDSAGVLAAHGEGVPDGEQTELGVPRNVSSREFQALLDRALVEWIDAGDASPAAETWPAFQARTGSALHDLTDSLGSGEGALVFTSAGVIAAVAASLIGAPGSSFVALNRIGVNCGVTKLASGRGGTHLVTFNDHSHIEHDRELTTFR